MARERIIAGLDLGTTKVSSVIAEVTDGELRVIGVGTVPSGGLRKGVVVNIEKTIKTIREAVGEAESMAGIKVDSLYVGIAGDHIQSLDNRGAVVVSHPDRGITRNDVDRVMSVARAVTIPMDRELIHVLPQEFIVDDQDGIKDPIGMFGVRLEARVHIVTGAVTSAQNIYKSVRQAGIKIKDLVLQPLASSYAVALPDEIELGVGILDIGGGTTDIALFFDGALRHVAVIGLGSGNVTNDIAIGLRTSLEEAEEIKKSHGCALSTMVKGDETFTVTGIGDRKPREVEKESLVGIIQPRMEEILSVALREIRKSDYADLLPSGLILTGGGALLQGTVELAERIFDMPVRLGLPRGVEGHLDLVHSPIYSTALGLILFASKDGEAMSRFKANGRLSGIWIKLKQWFEDFL